MHKILVLNGPNLNKLGSREPEVYGDDSLDTIISHTDDLLNKYRIKCELDWQQYNDESQIVDAIHGSDGRYQAIVINPGAFSHYSIAIYDAYKSISIPVYEVHLSQIYAREDMRQRLLTARSASMIMTGLGRQSYFHAILYYINSLDS